MRRGWRVVLGAVLLVSSFVPVTARADDGPSYRPFEISIFPPINIWHPKHKVIVGASLNVLYGHADSVYGVEIGAGVNREDGDVGGIQISGIANIVHGFAYGIQASVLWNEADGGCGPICIAGFANDHGHVVGLEIALFNYAKKVDGIQLGPFNGADDVDAGLMLGIMNYAKYDSTAIEIGLLNSNNLLVGDTEALLSQGTMRGLQIAAANTAYDLKGLQLSIGYNQARNDMSGVQITFLINDVAESMNGLQISCANFAHDVHGVQIGFINFTHGLHGVQIGLLNIATDNALPFMVGINAGF